MAMSRRDLIIYLRNLLGTAGLYPLLSSSAQSQNTSLPKDGHFFIFVELLGGAYHLLSTDYPDPDAITTISQKYPQAVMKFEHGKQGKGVGTFTSFTADPALKNYHPMLKDLKGKVEDTGGGLFFDNDMYRTFGYFTALPYNQANKDGFYRSPTDPEQRLGLAGLPLANYVKDISVVRSVYMQGTFHGFANKEVYSGSDKNKGKHIAEVIAQHQSNNNILPFLYMESASSGNVENTGKPWENFMNSVLDPQAAPLMPLIKNISSSMQNDFNLSTQQLDLLKQYEKTFPEVKTVSDSLSKIIDKSQDYSNINASLTAQIDLCLKVFSADMSRAITFSVGSERFFDTHGGNLYHIAERSQLSLLNQAMQDLADSIKMLQTTPYPGDPDNKKWSDVVTLVVSSEFGRPPNFNGGTSGYEEGTPGNGHFFPNNNYILFGKNVAKGMWLGKSDPITHFPHVVDFNALQQGNLASAFVDPLTADCKAPNKSPRFKSAFAGDSAYRDVAANQDVNVPHKKGTQQRTFMAKDIVKTIAAIAGIDAAKFNEYYEDEHYNDAQTITPLVNKS